MLKAKLTRAALMALVLLLGSAFVGYAHADPPEAPPQKKEQQKPKDQHFCCKSVNTDKHGKTGFGDGCALAEKVHIAACSTVLYCPGGYTLDNGAVTCPL